MTALLEVEGLRVGYGKIAVIFGIDLEVAEGELVALLGANGAGKTTTLRAVSSLLKPQAGTITFDGDRIDRVPPDEVARRGVVHVPEGRGVFPSLGVEETLRLAGRGRPKAAVESSLEKVYGLFPILADRRRQLVGTLSGGQRQMVALSRALLAEPKLLMIDELSQGLAPVVCDELFAVLPTIAAEGVAILLVEQFVGRALALASRAYVLTKGEVSFAGTAAELAADETFVAGSYLGHVDEEMVDEALAEVAAELGPAALIDPETTPLVRDLPPALRVTLAQLAAERGVEPVSLVAELLEREAAK